MGSKSSKKKRSGDPRVQQAITDASQPAPPAPTPTAATPASEWISSASANDIEILPLPSGNVARVRRSGPEAFMAQGIVPDALTAIVEKSIHSKKGLRPKDEVDIAKDPAKLGAMVEMLDRTVCYAVVEPRIIMPPPCIECGELNTFAAKQHDDQERDDYHEFKEGERRSDVVYADRVDRDDKQFIMQFTLGGTRDLERFRRQLRSRVAGVPTQ